MAIVGPCLPDPVVGVEATLEPGVFEVLDPTDYVEAVGKFRLQSVGRAGCKREQDVDPRAPALFRLLGVVAVIVGRIRGQRLAGRLVHGNGPRRRVRHWRQRNQSVHHLGMAHAPL